MGIKIAFGLLVVIFSTSMSTAAIPLFSRTKLKVGHKIISVEIADTPEKLSYGLMHRKSLGENEGMLFIFPQEQPLSFWMKNTYIDLSIAFFSKEKVLLEVKEMMAAKSELQSHFETYQSTRPAQYALEMRRGWFTRNNIKVGNKLELFIKK